MVENSFAIEYCGVPYFHYWFVIAAVLLAMWVPGFFRGFYRLSYYVVRLLFRLATTRRF